MALGVVVAAACYSEGAGSGPIANTFYYPIGLAVSAGGNVLYVVNSDFDLQFNAGTVQSYDLTAIRNDTVALLLGMYSNGGRTPVYDASLDGATVGAPTVIPFEAGIPEAGCPNTVNYDDGSVPLNYNDPNGWNGNLGRLPPGEACAPPIDSRHYFQDYVEIGAFATDIRFGMNYSRLYIPVRGSASIAWIDVQNDTVGDSGVPVPGPSPYQNVQNPTRPSYVPFQLSAPDGGCNNGVCTLGCGASTSPSHTCDQWHNAGALTDYGNTRQVQMPGEPFAMAFTDDGMAIALTQQTENETSLFLSGFVPSDYTVTTTFRPYIADAGEDAATPDAATDAAVDAGADDASSGAAPDASAATDDGGFPWADAATASLGTNEFPTSIQFLVQDMPLGGDGIASVPHDPAAIVNPDPANPVRPAFLQTSNQSAEIDLLRYYSDEGYQQNLNAPDGALEDAGVAVRVGSSNLRPFLLKERAYSVSTTNNGTNSRGIAIDPTPRIACEQTVLYKMGLPVTSPEYVACAQTPARVFIASRSPPALVIGQIGGMVSDGTTYDPDVFSLSGNVPLSAGPSNVYVAPIVNKDGNYEVRVFVVCFDSQTIAIYDPDAQRMENVVETGPGPFGMAFDPFNIVDVANHKHVEEDDRTTYTTIVDGVATGKKALLKYRFAYITSFTDSFVQVMDLDQSFKDDRLGVGQSSYEDMVYTLGVPTAPVGSN